jgi:hypothetical protein
MFKRHTFMRNYQSYKPQETVIFINTSFSFSKKFYEKKNKIREFTQKEHDDYRKRGAFYKKFGKINLNPLNDFQNFEGSIYSRENIQSNESFDQERIHINQYQKSYFRKGERFPIFHKKTNEKVIDLT